MVQLLVYADYVNILGGSVHSLKKGADALLAASKETGLEVNVDITKYMVMSRDQNAGRSHNKKIDNISFEREEQFKYVGKNLTTQNSTEEEIQSRSGNSCYHLVQNILSSGLLSESIKIKIYRTIFLHVVLYGCETWSLTLREERRLRVFENRVLRRIFGPKRDKVIGERKKRHNAEHYDL
jgi:phosphopantetheine adenylyltransferase